MIPAFDYRPGDARIADEIDEAIRRVRASGWLVLGPEVEAFEREFADWVGAAHGVGLASGTDALTLALRALGIGSGDEVVTVANAGVPTVAAICNVGATPRFVDVEPDGLLLDPARVESALTSRTRCLLPVHLYGRAAELEPLLALASRHGLAVVEDCAQAHGARVGERHVGTFGAIGCFSFYPTKNLGAYGDGGLCVTDDPALADRLKGLRFYGFGARDRHAHEEGANSRLDELQAAILRAKLGRLEAAVEERRAIAARYRAGLAEAGLALPSEPAGTRHAHHLYVVQSERRDAVREALTAAEIGSGIHYPEPVHTMQAYARLGCGAGELPVTERACRRVLSLPLFPGLDADAIDRVIATLATA